MIKDEASIISYIEFDTVDEWESVFRICAGYLTERAKTRLRGLAISSIIIEKQYIDRDYRNTFSNFHSKKFVTPQSRCIRLHLFTDSIPFENPTPEEWNKCYAGYIILRPTLPNSIGRTLLSSNLFPVKGSFLCLCKETPMVNGVALKIEGFPFISQDTDATVCAQSSLWMLLRFFSNRYKWYKEVYPSELSAIVKAHPQGRSMPGAGLTMIQMADVLRSLTFAPLLYDKDEYGANFYKIAYYYIESGIPLLLGLPSHVVVALGHQSDLALKGNNSSYDYFTGYIVNDDNGLPYSKLTSNKSDNPFGYNLDDIDSFLVPLPDKVFISAEQFEALCNDLIKLLQIKGINAPPFSRIFLTTGRAFRKKALERYSQLQEIRSFYLKYPLPHFIWVCELSEPDLYSKTSQCRGEIIWDATRNIHDGHLGLVIHIQGTIIFDQGAAWNVNPNYNRIDTKCILPYNIYCNNLEEVL